MALATIRDATEERRLIYLEILKRSCTFSSVEFFSLAGVLDKTERA